jgi:threonine dehydrogenase-like Zn-dependent dehydrogenase
MQHHYLGCGACPQCATGWSQLCDLGKATLYGSTAHGAHARFLRVPAKTLVPLPDGLSFEAGAAIACGTGTAWGALQRMGIKAEHTVAIFGQGPVGLSATQLARAMGARVIALDTSAERLQRALELGADLALDPRAADPVETIRESTRGLGADAALDTSAAPLARAQAVRCVRTWGEVCFVGEGDTVTLNVSGDLIRRQVTLRGSWAFSTVLQAACARFIADRQVPVDQLFTHRWPLEQAAEAYRIFDQQSAGKGVLLPAA